MNGLGGTEAVPEVPEVPARPRGAQLVLDCPFCGREHRHGLGGGYGGRQSHCHGGGRAYRLVKPS